MQLTGVCWSKCMLVCSCVCDWKHKTTGSTGSYGPLRLYEKQLPIAWSFSTTNLSFDIIMGLVQIIFEHHGCPIESSLNLPFMCLRCSFKSGELPCPSCHTSLTMDGHFRALQLFRLVSGIHQMSIYQSTPSLIDEQQGVCKLQLLRLQNGGMRGLTAMSALKIYHRLSRAIMWPDCFFPEGYHRCCAHCKDLTDPHKDQLLCWIRNLKSIFDYYLSLCHVDE